MTEDKYYIKYLKYKNLYLELNKQLGGEIDHEISEYISKFDNIGTDIGIDNNFIKKLKSIFEVINELINDNEVLIDFIINLQFYIYYLKHNKIKTFNYNIVDIKYYFDNPTLFSPCNGLNFLCVTGKITTIEDKHKYNEKRLSLKYNEYIYKIVNIIDSSKQENIIESLYVILWNSNKRFGGDYNDPIDPNVISKFCKCIIKIINNKLFLSDDSNTEESFKDISGTKTIRKMQDINFIKKLILKLEEAYKIDITEKVLDQIIVQLQLQGK